MKRWTTCILMALCGLAPAPGLAQGPWAPPAPSSVGVHDQLLPAPGGPPIGANCPPAGYDLYQQLVPGPGILYDTDSRHDLTLREAFANSYFRVDYLLWNISGADGTLLGAPVSSNADLSGQDALNRLPAVDPVNGPRQLTSAIVPDLSRATSQNLSGVRGVMGIPTLVGTFEAEVFGFEELRNDIRIAPFVDTQIPGVPQTLIGATTLLNNGNISDTTMILYSEGYHARQYTTLWGPEANWIFNPFVPNVPVEVSPIIGFRYIAMKDLLSITGQDIPDPVNDPTTVLNHEISSLARNNIFGPQFGLKMSTHFWKFDLGAETKFIAGINRLQESVVTEEIYSPTEPRNTDSDTRTRFAPIFDLSLYSKLHLTEHFSLYVGYDLLVGGGFSRAFDNIYYNAPASVSNGPAIRLDPHLTKFVAHGVAVGGELVFR